MKCLKCGDYFKIREVIDGKVRNLSARAYCLKCSPFGARNTRTLHEAETQKILKKKLRG